MQQFRYGDLFNDLPVARQGRLLARLLESDDRRVAKVIEWRRGESGLFRVEAVVRSADQLHVIAWMGTGFYAPVPPLYQGTTHSLIFVCAECTPDATVNQYTYAVTMVNDVEWRGRYRMYSVPLAAPLRHATSFHVVAERVLAVGSQYEPTGILPGPMASTQIRF